MLNSLRTELSAHRTVPADSSELSPSLRRAHTDVQAGGADTPQTTAELTPRPPFRAGGTKPIGDEASAPAPAAGEYPYGGRTSLGRVCP